MTPSPAARLAPPEFGLGQTPRHLRLAGRPDRIGEACRPERSALVAGIGDRLPGR